MIQKNNQPFVFDFFSKKLFDVILAMYSCWHNNNDNKGLYS